MANLLSRLVASRRHDHRSAYGGYGQVIPFPGGQFGVSSGYLRSYIDGVERVPDDFEPYVDAVRACPPAFSAQNVRAKVLSEARFVWRNHGRDGRPAGRIWTSAALGPLEVPWENGTTGDLISKMEWHAGLAGNAYVYRNRAMRRLQVLRPDWVTIVFGSKREPSHPAQALDAELLGYVYLNGGERGGNKPTTLLPRDVAHWAPIPDPEMGHVGMSWLTPAIREMVADSAVTEHKLAFFRHGATPNLVVSGVKAKDPGEFKQIVDMLESQHAGVHNSYRTIYLKEGADASVVGTNLKDLDLKTVQGASETRIASLSQVPAAILNLSEGLQGSALNAGNLGQTRRNFGDTWCHPTWRSLSAALGSITDVPSDSELWFDASDVPFLRDDETDLAEIRQADAITLRNLVDSGFDADAAVAYVQTGDLAQLLGAHSGLFSVQLQPADENGDPPARIRVPAADLARLGVLFPGHRVLAVEPVAPMKALPPGGS